MDHYKKWMAANSADGTYVREKEREREREDASRMVVSEKKN